MIEEGLAGSNDSEERSTRLVYGVPTFVDNVIVLTVFDRDDLHLAPYPLETYRLGVSKANADLSLEGLRNIAKDEQPASCGDFLLAVNDDGTADVISMPWVGEASTTEENLAAMNALREVRGVTMKIPDHVLAERAALEYRTFAGQVVLGTRAYCYEGEADGDWVNFDEPIAMRVHPFSNNELNGNVIRWTDHGQIDPVYSVSALEDHPDLHGKRISWTDGTSYSAKGAIEAAGFVAASPEIQRRYANVDAVDTESVPTPTGNVSSPWYLIG